MAFDFYKHRHFPKISTIAVVIAFLMPFFIVKCGNTEIDQISGVELMTGKSDIGGEQDKESAMDLSPRPFALMGFLCALAGAIFAWMTFKKRKLIQFIIACAGFVLLVLLFVDVKGTDVNQSSSEMLPITIELSYGYFTAQLGFAISALFYGFDFRNDQKTKPFNDEKIVDQDVI